MDRTAPPKRVRQLATRRGIMPAQMSDAAFGSLLLAAAGIALLVGGAVWNFAASRANARGVSLGPRAVAFGLPGLGLLLTVAGGYSFLATGPPPLTPDEQRALQIKFNEELNAVVARCNADTETLRQQRISATAGVASARPILAEKAVADESARQQLRTNSLKAEDNHTAARAAADRAKEDALLKADAALRAAEPAAEQRKNSRNDDFQSQYKKALDSARAVANIIDRGALEKKAREALDQSLVNSTAEYDRDRAAANTAWGDAQVEAEAQRIRAYEAAEAAYQQDLAAAARDFSRANDAAAATASTKLNQIPESAAVTRSFDDRERELNDRCQREKEDIFRRMREQFGVRR